MRFFLAVITTLLLFSPTLSAQDGLISFGLSVSPDRSSPSTFLYSYVDETRDGYQLIETGKTTATMGIVTQYWLSKWVTLRLGILYSDKGYKQTRIPTTFGPSEETRYRFSYLSLPLTIKTPLHQGPAFVYVTTGISTDIFLHGHGGYFSFFDDTFAQVSMSYQMGIGAEVQVNEKFNFGFEPTFRLAVTDYSLNRQYRPFSLGLMLRLIYR